MNRRELFQSVAAVAASSGVDVKAAVIEQPSVRPALAVFEVKHSIPDATVDRLMRQWNELTAGTPLEGVKAVVLAEGLKLTLLDEQGHVLNRTVEDVRPPLRCVKPGCEYAPSDRSNYCEVHRPGSW